jgi:hypothetical protein
MRYCQVKQGQAMKRPTTREMVTKLVTNDMPHIQARLAGLETQGRITIALVLGLVLAVVGGAIAVLTGR